MPAPIRRSPRAINFTKPSVSPSAWARPSAAKGILPTTTSPPSARARASLTPTVAISGELKMTLGIAL
jgi:hypothetical protein